MSPGRLLRALGRRAVWLVKGRPRPPLLLEMVWPESLRSPPPVPVPAGFQLRQFRPTDADSYQALLTAAEMGRCPLEYWDAHLLPDGFFVVEYAASSKLVAACFAAHHPTARHFQAGNFGWLAADPAYRGQGLGKAVAVAVVSRLLAAGYRRIYLETHDHRLPAIRLYLTMGWQPLLYAPEMAQRWNRICEQLGWAYTPEKWPA